MTKETDFPEIIKQLPEADQHFPGVCLWILQGKDHQVGFSDIAALGEVEEHSHGAQWGIVLDGEMELTISGETKVYKKGDVYYIPSGAPHSGNFPTRVKTLDFFEDRDRYPIRERK